MYGDSGIGLHRTRVIWLVVCSWESNTTYQNAYTQKKRAERQAEKVRKAIMEKGSNLDSDAVAEAVQVVPVKLSHITNGESDNI